MPVPHKPWRCLTLVIGVRADDLEPNSPEPSARTYLLLLISMLWHRQAIFESKGDKLSSSAECRIRTQRVSETQSPADWMPADKPTELSRIKLKTRTRECADSTVPIHGEFGEYADIVGLGWVILLACLLLDGVIFTGCPSGALQMISQCIGDSVIICLSPIIREDIVWIT